MKDWSQYFARIIREFSSLIMYGVNYKPLLKADRKKLSAHDVEFFTGMITHYVKMSTMEMIYVKTCDLVKDETLSDKQRFELLWGDIEDTLRTSIHEFASKYDKTKMMGSYEFEDIRKRFEVKND